MSRVSPWYSVIIRVLVSDRKAGRRVSVRVRRDLNILNFGP